MANYLDYSGLSYFYNKIKSIISNNVTALDNRVTNLENEDNASLINNFNQYYIDCVNGSDSNVGTNAAPFKTLTKLYEVANKKGLGNIRGVLKSSGDYPITGYRNISNVSIHIFCSSDSVNARIIFDNPQELSFYNCHINIQGSATNYITIVDNTSHGFWWCDGCTIAFVYVNIASYVSFFGGSVKFTSCAINRIRGINSNIIFEEGLQVTNTKPQFVFYLSNCLFSFTGAVTHVNELSSAATAADQTYFMQYGGVSYIGSMLINRSLTNKYYRFMRIQSGVVQCTASRLTNPRTYGAQNDNSYMGGALFVTGDYTTLT